MTMVEQHELALAILRWVGILTLPAFYAGLYFTVRRADRQERAAQAIEAQRAMTTKIGVVEDESAVPKECANTPEGDI
jgi:hypothetical protein